MFLYIILIGCNYLICTAYKNHLYTIAKLDEAKTKEYKCLVYQSIKTRSQSARKEFEYNFDNLKSLSYNESIKVNDSVVDPLELYQCYLHKFLFGNNIELDDQDEDKSVLLSHGKSSDSMRHYVIGNFMRGELFNNRSGVHLPQLELLHRGHCVLNITKDFMQTAVNAFAIFLHGTLDDVERLPADYVLRSSRTISMMKIAREKLAATWTVVRGGKPTDMITYETLELYRPLFKYINAREIARLNLSDERILTFIGTHADLDRHQVGVIANKYIYLNKHWREPKYLNLMNNLLCGVPMTFMREIPVNSYLQLSNQVFYHIRACDPLQRRFYLAIMTKTQALGKSYSWNARDVSRLGLLLAEVGGSELSSINPEAMAGITAQVMVYMAPENLQFLSAMQLRHIAPRPLSILARKLKSYNDQLQFNAHSNRKLSGYTPFLSVVLNKILILLIM